MNAILDFRDQIVPHTYIYLTRVGNYLAIFLAISCYTYSDFEKHLKNGENIFLQFFVDYSQTNLNRAVYLLTWNNC